MPFRFAITCLNQKENSNFDDIMKKLNGNKTPKAGAMTP